MQLYDSINKFSRVSKVKIMDPRVDTGARDVVPLILKRSTQIDRDCRPRRGHIRSQAGRVGIEILGFELSSGVRGGKRFDKLLRLVEATPRNDNLQPRLCAAYAIK